MSFRPSGLDLQTAGATSINRPCLDTPTALRWQWSLPRPPRRTSAVAELVRLHRTEVRPDVPDEYLEGGCK